MALREEVSALQDALLSKQAATDALHEQLRSAHSAANEAHLQVRGLASCVQSRRLRMNKGWGERTLPLACMLILL